MNNYIFTIDFYFEKKRNKDKIIFKYQPAWSKLYNDLDLKKLIKNVKLYRFPVYLICEKEFDYKIFKVLIKSSKIGNFDVAKHEFKKFKLNLISNIELLEKEIYKRIL